MLVRRGLLLSLLVVGLAGCSSSTHPTVLPPLPSTAPTASATPTPCATPPPVQPGVGMNAATPAGATAFAKYYFATIVASFYTRDDSKVRALSAPGCMTCSRYIRSIASIRAGDQHTRQASASSSPSPLLLRWSRQQPAST